MHHIKLDATYSTNDYLKDLTACQHLENYTVVTAEHQTKGKGQMGATWQSESGKNLIMSMLFINEAFVVQSLFDLNVAIATSIIEVLTQHDIPNLAIKWPNDIMSGNRKIGGILIENSLKANKSLHSVIGFGLNVNQTEFSNLPKASSLASISGRTFDRESLLLEIVAAMQRSLEQMQANPKALWLKYHQNLFKVGIPMAFENQLGDRFMGIIKEVSSSGKLGVVNEQDTIEYFSIRDVTMLY